MQVPHHPPISREGVAADLPLAARPSKSIPSSTPVPSTHHQPTTSSIRRNSNAVHHLATQNDGTSSGAYPSVFSALCPPPATVRRVAASKTPSSSHRRTASSLPPADASNPHLRKSPPSPSDHASPPSSEPTGCLPPWSTATPAPRRGSLRSTCPQPVLVLRDGTMTNNFL